MRSEILIRILEQVSQCDKERVLLNAEYLTKKITLKEYSQQRQLLHDKYIAPSKQLFYEESNEQDSVKV